VRNRDLARLERFGDFAHQFDMEHTILVARIRDADMFGQSKAALKSARCYAAVQLCAAIGLFVFAGFAGRNKERIFTLLDTEIILGKALNGD
jgi:hypothetical protein